MGEVLPDIHLRRLREPEDAWLSLPSQNLANTRGQSVRLIYPLGGIVVVRAVALQGKKPGKGGADSCVISLTVPEVRRLVWAMTAPEERRGFHLDWSRRRRTPSSSCRPLQRRTLRL